MKLRGLMVTMRGSDGAGSVTCVGDTKVPSGQTDRGTTGHPVSRTACCEPWGRDVFHMQGPFTPRTIAASGQVRCQLWVELPWGLWSVEMEIYGVRLPGF